MSTRPGLRSALLVTGIYTIIVGVLLFFPSWASVVFARTIKDAAATSGWGTGLITIGLLALAATDVEKHAGLAWIFVVGLLLATVDLIYFWTAGEYTPRNVLVPIIINIVLAAWLWSARPNG
jgi:hypothetical protein